MGKEEHVHFDDMKLYTSHKLRRDVSKANNNDSSTSTVKTTPITAVKEENHEKAPDLLLQNTTKPTIKVNKTTIAVNINSPTTGIYLYLLLIIFQFYSWEIKQF